MPRRRDRRDSQVELLTPEPVGRTEMRYDPGIGLDDPGLGDLQRDVNRMRLETSSNLYAVRRQTW